VTRSNDAAKEERITCLEAIIAAKDEQVAYLREVIASKDRRAAAFRKCSSEPRWRLSRGSQRSPLWQTSFWGSTISRKGVEFRERLKVGLARQLPH
jgi:hypothetical protein